MNWKVFGGLGCTRHAGAEDSHFFLALGLSPEGGALTSMGRFPRTEVALAGSQNASPEVFCDGFFSKKAPFEKNFREEVILTPFRLLSENPLFPKFF